MAHGHRRHVERARPSRLRRASTSSGPPASIAYARSPERSSPISVAARTPLPATSPITTASSPDGSGSASYQSPPTSTPAPGRKRAASSSPSIVGQPRRQQAALQRLGDPALALDDPRARDRQRRALGGRDEQREVVLAEAVELEPRTRAGRRSTRRSGTTHRARALAQVRVHLDLREVRPPAAGLRRSGPPRRADRPGSRRASTASPTAARDEQDRRVVVEQQQRARSRPPGDDPDRPSRSSRRRSREAGGRDRLELRGCARSPLQLLALAHELAVRVDQLVVELEHLLDEVLLLADRPARRRAAASPARRRSHSAWSVAHLGAARRGARTRPPATRRPALGQAARERVALGRLDQRVEGRPASAPPASRSSAGVGGEHGAVRRRLAASIAGSPSVALDPLADHAARVPLHDRGTASRRRARTRRRRCAARARPSRRTPSPPTSTNGAGSSAAQRGARPRRPADPLRQRGRERDDVVAPLGRERGEVRRRAELAEERTRQPSASRKSATIRAADGVQLVAHAGDERRRRGAAAPARRAARPAAPSWTAWRRSRGAPGRR